MVWHRKQRQHPNFRDNSMQCVHRAAKQKYSTDWNTGGAPPGMSRFCFFFPFFPGPRAFVLALNKPKRISATPSPTQLNRFAGFNQPQNGHQLQKPHTDGAFVAGRALRIFQVCVLGAPFVPKGYFLCGLALTVR